MKEKDANGKDIDTGDFILVIELSVPGEAYEKKQGLHGKK